jgi:hypothetical protein
MHRAPATLILGWLAGHGPVHRGPQARLKLDGIVAFLQFLLGFLLNYSIQF